MYSLNYSECKMILLDTYQKNQDQDGGYEKTLEGFAQYLVQNNRLTRKQINYLLAIYKELSECDSKYISILKGNDFNESIDEIFDSLKNEIREIFTEAEMYYNKYDILIENIWELAPEVIKDENIPDDVRDIFKEVLEMKKEVDVFDLLGTFKKAKNKLEKININEKTKI